MSRKIFEKRYDGETLFDIERDISEAVEGIQTDEEGTVTVTITWKPKEKQYEQRNRS